MEMGVCGDGYGCVWGWVWVCVGMGHCLDAVEGAIAILVHFLEHIKHSILRAQLPLHLWVHPSTVMADIIMAYIVMAYIVMAYIVPG